MMDRLQDDITNKLACQIRYQNDVSIVQVSDKPLELWFPSRSYFLHQTQPYILSCPLPKARKNEGPVSVSIVDNVDACTAPTNALRVLNEHETREMDFVVCVKALHFPFKDESKRIREWIEIILAFGADKIVFYVLDVHENVWNILNSYNNKVVEVRNVTLPGDRPIDRMGQYMVLKSDHYLRIDFELIGLNDCLYR